MLCSFVFLVLMYCLVSKCLLIHQSTSVWLQWLNFIDIMKLICTTGPRFPLHVDCVKTTEAKFQLCILDYLCDIYVQCYRRVESWKAETMQDLLVGDTYGLELQHAMSKNGSTTWEAGSMLCPEDFETLVWNTAREKLRGNGNASPSTLDLSSWEGCKSLWLVVWHEVIRYHVIISSRERKLFCIW